MAISHDQASFMTLITALIGAKWAVEVGTFTGTSSIAIARGLAPGGRLLLGTHLGTGEHTRPTRAYGGHPVSYESFLLPVEQIVGLLEDAGFDLEWRTLEQPAPREHTRILARRR